MIVKSSAASRTLAVIGPAVSWLWLIGTICVRLTSPTVGFSPTMPLIDAGQVTEPSVSVPIAIRTRPAATAAPLPLDEPQGLRSSAHGLRVCPPTALQPEIDRVERIFAHSLRFVLPTMTAPAARSRATKSAPRTLASAGRGCCADADEATITSDVVTNCQRISPSLYRQRGASSASSVP